jgi:hypothetical protein
MPSSSSARRLTATWPLAPSCVPEDMTQELQVYSGSYPVEHNDAEGSLLGNECEE